MSLLISPLANSRIESILSKPGSSYIFAGPSNLGKFTSALNLAVRLNCAKKTGCGECSSCRLTTVGNNPDVMVVVPTDKGNIGLGQIQEVQAKLRLAPFSPGGWRVLIIDGAESLTEEAQNSLLKLLEEPPTRTLIVLVTISVPSLLGTIQSRCQLVQFDPLPDAAIAEFAAGLGLKPAAVDEVTACSLGRIGLAHRLIHDPDALTKLHQTRELAADLLNADLFTKLTLAGKLAETEPDLSTLVYFLAHNLQVLLRQNAASASAAQTQLRKLQAIEKFQRYVEANVGYRSSLEGLMLELA